MSKIKKTTMPVYTTTDGKSFTGESAHEDAEKHQEYLDAVSKRDILKPKVWDIFQLPKMDNIEHICADRYEREYDIVMGFIDKLNENTGLDFEDFEDFYYFLSELLLRYPKEIKEVMELIEKTEV